MTKNPMAQVWLTSVLTDADVPNALTLCFSLRKVMTSHSLAVIVSPKVSMGLREALNYGFDFIFILEEDRNIAGLEAEDFVKLFALTLQGFNKCVMLSPSMLVVKNCDELFAKGEDSSQTFIWSEKGDTTSILVVRPSLQIFKWLMKGIAKRNGTGVDIFLKKWLTNQTPNCQFLDEKYNQQSGSLFLKQEKEIAIVNLNNKSTKKIEGGKKILGFVGERIEGLWKTMHDEKVLPLLNALANPSICEEPESPHRAFKKDAIAIVGMSCRYPSANSVQEFWQLLLDGKDGTGNPPEFRWLREQCSRHKPESRKVNAGFLKCPVDDFDAKFFNVSPKEMVFMDPQQRLLHELVWEGLEDAAIDPLSLEGTNGGVFIGSWLNDYKDILSHTGSNDFYRMYMGNSIGAGAARISHFLGITGPSIATESGCSSAMVALHLACKSLQRRETNMALACGVNLLLHPFDGDEMPMVVSPDGHCKTFDANANGFARGEGCGVLVLKRLSDAIRDQDNIWALVRGTGMTQEGVSKSMGTPTIHCESLAMKEALQDARVDPSKISYVEAHGTGTTVGDPMEVAAIAKAYHSKERMEPLMIGSVKTNVGHTESCSGITGIMKVVLAMQHEIIPPHRNFETLNPAIDLEAVPARIPLEQVKWPKKLGTPRMAGVSSFGITGTDAHAILEETPSIPAPALTLNNFERPLHILKISAKTDEALDILLENYKNHLGTSAHKLQDLAFTANIGRADFSQRATIIAKSKEDAIKSIEQNKFIRGEESPPENMGKICFLFTGQGSQYPGMGKELYETSPVFQMHFDHCYKILKELYNIDIKKVLWSNDKSSSEVSRTIYSQTSIFCVEYALLKLWESWGVKPDYALGHSLGEFAAAVCAGILSVEDGIKLVAERSRLIDELPRGKMLVIKADKQKVDSLLSKFAGKDQTKTLDYAAINSLEQTVVAGDSEVVLEFSESCKNAGLKCIILEATHAFHSKHMDPMLGAYGQVAKTVKKLEGNDKCKYISGMTGTLLDPDQVDVEFWVKHTREKVNFLEASKKAVELGCNIFIEVGPQPVLSALTMMNNEDTQNQQLTCVPSLKRNEKEWDTLLNTLSKLYLKGLKIDWMGFDQFQDRRKVSLPHYPFSGKTFWPDLLAVGGSTIHPLIGSVIPNASSTKLFQNGINLRDLDYVKDHAIGENVIFPGAGYLEMCLAAGLATVEGSTDILAPPTRPMKVENLTIQAPFSLDESKTSQVQTVVDFNMSSENDGDWNDMKVCISRRMESESTKWLAHAKATFSPLPTAEEKTLSFDTNNFIQTQSKSSNDKFIQEIYNKLASLGLKFGPQFRSIDKLWRSDEKEGTLLAKVKVPPGDANFSSNQYIIHPVILDAMIQAIMMLRLTSNLKKKLYVPIKIGKFLWLSSPSQDSSADLFIHAFEPETNNPSSGSAFLLDSNGKILAAMSSVEFIDTTVKAIDSVLEQQTSTMPNLWNEVWKPSMGPQQFRGDLLEYKTNYAELNLCQDDYKTLDPNLSEIFSQTEKLVYLHMLNCLYELGWKPVIGETFREEDLHQQLGIQKTNRQYLGFILEILELEGFLKKESVSNQGTEITWKVINMPPSPQEAQELLASPMFTTELTAKYSTTPLFNEVGKNLSKIMIGQQAALSILFPEENAKYPSVSEFYMTYFNMYRMKVCISETSSKKMAQVKAKLDSQSQRGVCRILEVGAGTGSYTSFFLDLLKDLEIEFEYTYTDISAAFFAGAEKRFEKHLKHMKFKKLNIEEDPIDQGFIPEYFDIVCASDVIHTTKDIKETLRNVRMLMRPYATFDIQEITKPHRFVTFLFGLLDGFWRFEDFELRPRHCALSRQNWEKVLSSSGFEVTGNFPMVNDHQSYIWAVRTPQPLEMRMPKNRKAWLIFHQGENDDSQVSAYIKKRMEEVTTRRVISIYAAQTQTFELSGGQGDTAKIRRDVEEDYASLFKILKAEQVELEGIVYCWALTSNECSQAEILQPYFYLTKAMLSAGLNKLPALIGLTKGSIAVGDTDLSNFPLSTLWGFTKTLGNENIDVSLKIIDVETGPLVVRQLEEIFCELWNFGKESMLAYREGTRFYPKFQSHKSTCNPLQLPPGTDRFKLILPESKSISDLRFGPLDMRTLKENEVEVQIKASALNFRDVLSVIKPSEQFKDINSVGFDMAGIVKRIGANVTKWKVGDRVCGCNMNFSALPSHVNVKENILMGVPPHSTLCEAATLPAVYMTCVVCLLDVAKIKKEDVVLIHTASGGVGLSAIEICKHVGCTIIATAGSKRKQNYLRSLGIQHIFHSRKTQYGDQILELTNGRGVDVVLNSLTSEGFKEATLKACAKNARFVEMSKLNIWKPEEVKELRPDVSYTIVDISATEEAELIPMFNKVKELVDSGIAKPIPYVRFESLHIREALQYMQKAKHIGKIVCVMPELLINEGGEIKVHTPMFNDNSTYLITGGLGGIGFVVCKWMIEKGAKHVILAGRSPPTSSIQRQINELNSNGATVISVQLDVGNFEQCKDLVQTKIREMGLPTLRGVMHAAGTLSDGLIVNQTWPKLSSTFNTKVDGTLNLHELTKNLNLEHFVMFSSMAALLGSPGQCNHSAGNSFEDALVHYRYSQGLPATTINWGQWGEVGIATEVDLPGVKTFSNVQGLTGLEYVLNSHRVQLPIINIESFRMLSKLFPHLAAYLDESVWKSSGVNTSVTIKSEEFWQQYESKIDMEEKLLLVQEQLKNILRGVLKLDDSDIINADGNFEEMGVDSLMFIEIKNHLQTLLGGRLTINASALKDSNTINLLAETLVKLIDGESDDEVGPPTTEEVNELIREDCILPEHIAAKPGQMLGSVRDIKTVLLAGCTGTLGPYVLKELTKKSSQISEVVCLMRKSNNETPDERLSRFLTTRELISEVDMNKVRYVTGNVALPNLGLEKEIWEELSGTVDAIINCSARVQHNEHYRKRNSTTDVRAVNIGGTKNLLQFACEKKLKHVYQAASLLSVVKTDGEPPQVSEDWPCAQDYDGVTKFAYPISKHVGDVLVKEAVERGIPCKVFRLPLITGESKTGRCAVESNHALLRYLFIMKNGIMPSTPFPIPMIPADVCAEVSLRVFFDERAPSDIYNVGNAKVNVDQEFVNVAKKFGYHVNIVELTEFLTRVNEAAQQDSTSALKMFAEMYSDEDALMASYASSPVIQRWVEGNDGIFGSTKIPALIPNFYENQRPAMDYIYKDLMFIKQKGWFEKFGL